MRNKLTAAVLLCFLLPGTSALSLDKQPADTDTRIKSVRGLLVPLVESTLSSQISGRINAINVEEGARFSKDDILVEFDCAIQQARLQKARAELVAARKRHEANLKLKEFNSIGDLDLAISAADVDKAKAEYALNRSQVGMCQIVAPFDGRAVKRIARPYESVSQGQPLIEILDDSELKIELYVPSRWLLWLKPATDFSIRIDETGKSYPASVSSIGARVDAVSQSVEITATISGDHPELLSGMSGEALFNLPASP